MKLKLISLLVPVFVGSAGYVQAKTGATSGVSAQIIRRFTEQIYQETQASGMAMIVIDGDKKFFTHAGQTRRGHDQRPQRNTLIRIASLTKLITSETLVKLEQRGQIRLSDPLQKYAPPAMTVPAYHGHVVTLQHLATHTAGLPRELPGGKPSRPVFIWPQRATRWSWLQRASLHTIPGTVASYSNLGFDLLADGLARASGQPYPTLLRRLVTRPLGMKDTTYTPSPDQCRRLMIPASSASPCNNTLAAIGSGGLYSTPDDMGRWMQQFLNSSLHHRTALAAKLQQVIYPGSQLLRMTGMNVAGPASGLGLGWVHMPSASGRITLIEKTGGGGGFMTYMVMAPQHNIGVFVVVARSEGSHFSPMSHGANNLVTALVESRS